VRIVKFRARSRLVRVSLAHRRAAPADRPSAGLARPRHRPCTAAHRPAPRRRRAWSACQPSV